MLKPSLCNYSDAYILVKKTISVVATAAGGGNNDKEIILKIFSPFTHCTIEKNKIQIDISWCYALKGN